MEQYSWNKALINDIIMLSSAAYRFSIICLTLRILRNIDTLSVFKFAQYYFSRGLEFAHLICGEKREKLMKRADYPL